jgi:putative oxidoreductase
MTYTSEQSAAPREISASPTAAGRSARSSFLSRAGSLSAVVDRAGEINARFAPATLRVALALVFVWFGALKLAGVSPVIRLIASTLPFVDPDVSLAVLGGIEVAIGLVLLTGRFPRTTLLVLAGHLTGTFLTFVTASALMFEHGRPWQLTADGEFVVKNLVLISAALVLIGWYSSRTPAAESD